MPVAGDEKAGGDGSEGRIQESSSSRPSVPQLFFVACLIFSVVDGLVPKEDVVFAILASVYIVVMNRKVFPAVTSSLLPSMFLGNRVFSYYIRSAAVIGLLLPLVYVFSVYFQGDRIALKEATPSLFLLICQVLSENYTYRRRNYSLMTRTLVPILYNTRRIFTLWSWSLFMFGRSHDQFALSSPYFHLFAQIVVAANVILWNYNLFCFLLPVFLPGSMRQYYEIEQKRKQ